MLIGDLCKDISTRLGTFVEEYGRLNQDEPTATNVQNMRSKKQRTDTGDEDDEDDWEGDSESDEENDDSDDDEQHDDEAILGEVPVTCRRKLMIEMEKTTNKIATYKLSLGGITDWQMATLR